MFSHLILTATIFGFWSQLVCRLLEPEEPPVKLNPLKILQAYTDDEYFGDWEVSESYCAHFVTTLGSI